MDIRSFDYIRQILGVAVRFEAAQQESLVLLARLRPTGRRELLLIFGAAGALMHQEIIERTDSLQSGGPVLWRSGAVEGPGAVTVDVGRPIRYEAAR